MKRQQIIYLNNERKHYHMDNDIKQYHKVGKHGSEETDKDERNSKECIFEIFEKCQEDYPIKGYGYRLVDKIRDDRVYKRDIKGYEGNATYGIMPDGKAIILENNKDPMKEWYLFLSIEDKFQKTDGNAIERAAKNFIVMYEKVTRNSDVCPYVIFCSGEAFVDECGNKSNYFNAKWRQILPDTNVDNDVIIRHYDDPHTPFKNGKDLWNLLYIQNDRFTYEDKLKYLIEEVVNPSYEYFKEKLEKKK